MVPGSMLRELFVGAGCEVVRVEQGEGREGTECVVKGGVRESSGGSKSKSIQGTSSETTKTKGPAERVRVQGARRIWGTMKQTTHTSLKHVILKFCPTIISALKLSVKPFLTRMDRSNAGGLLFMPQRMF